MNITDVNDQVYDPTASPRGKFSEYMLSRVGHWVGLDVMTKEVSFPLLRNQRSVFQPAKHLLTQKSPYVC